MTNLTVAERLGIEPFETAPRIELRSNWTEEDLQMVIRAAYRQVLGNDYIMKSDRLTSAESLLRQGDLTVQDFVRAIALSELYRQKFFYSSQQIRFIELNYKHLLGRAPYDESEIADHVDLYAKKGYAAEINSYIDSNEYEDNFGYNIVPYYRGFTSQLGQKTVGYNRIFQLYRGYANSDRAQTSSNLAKLTREIAQNLPSSIPVSTSVTLRREDPDRIQKLVAAAVQRTKSTAPSYTRIDPTLERQCQEQAELIKKLQQQLAQLRPTAALGEAWTNKWQSYSPPTTPESSMALGTPAQNPATPGQSVSYIEWQQLAQKQTETIAALQQQIAQARSLAAIGEARLNKWRSRTFSG
ncbi:phycobilisome rod-core linker polypeptide [Coleofasciculus sp. LEGE 07092]|nr:MULTISPECIES: phycobilisome rod-core linker polypeptide [unclassified Coleofasciculus]MBE9126416.1 phycobilisome rod-core linker polypeptide [Coleofasciculus sp. LEGE 07081]MBE9148018.1 phycobilisome rod-core linker polypeptide [Coleofasciculus sp. LEGE 07092]